MPGLSRGARMSGSQWGAVGGAVIGGLLAAPTGGMSLLMGASLGLSVGSIVGAYIDPMRVQGPRLTDTQTQTSTVGGMIPFGYGRYVTAGNIIWCDALKEERHRRRHGKQVDKTFAYARSYAIGVCEGPISGFVWIKRNGKTVYSSSQQTTAEEQAAYNQFLQRCTLYTGTEEQSPDATIVAVEGVGNVSAFRGLAYIVVTHEDLTDLAGAIPQYEFCVDATLPDVIYTSRPYSHDLAVEGVGMVSSLATAQLKEGLVRVPADSMQMQASISGGFLSTALHAAQMPTDGLQMQAAVVASWELRTLLHRSIAAPEGVQMQAAGLSSGTLKHALNTTQIPAEAVQMHAASLVSGTLS